MYDEITVVVDGAVEETHRFSDYALEDKFLEDVEAEALEDGLNTKIYRLEHPHEPGEACECAQFVTDHTPLVEYNPKS